MLPYGMFMHKMYDHQKFRSVVKLRETHMYTQRKGQVTEVAEQIKEQRKKMQLSLVTEKKTETAAKAKPVKKVPEVVTSAKFLMMEKKDREKEADKADKGKK